MIATPEPGCPPFPCCQKTSFRNGSQVASWVDGWSLFSALGLEEHLHLPPQTQPDCWGRTRSGLWSTWGTRKTRAWAYSRMCLPWEMEGNWLHLKRWTRGAGKAATSWLARTRAARYEFKIRAQSCLPVVVAGRQVWSTLGNIFSMCSTAAMSGSKGAAFRHPPSEELGLRVEGKKNPDEKQLAGVIYDF